ncbi:MAG: helix-turn-helix transcriptional regulator [Methylotenera sp.]|nr:helix-turn-helix transcriptional regulator [Methylotenera sp.]
MESQLEHIKSTLAHSITKRRKALGISQERLALDADVDRTYVSQLERKIANPSLSTLCRISEVLQCDLLVLLSKTDDL